MADFSQQGAQLQLFFTPPQHQGEHPLPALLPVRLAGAEQLGASYSFTIDAMIPRGEPVPFDRLLGAPATARVETPGGADRHFSGIVWSVRHTGADESFDRYQLVLRPALDRLGLTRRTRVFQQVSALQVIDSILGPVGGAHHEHLGDSPTRACCVQYRETDLEFFLRLCSEEGIIHFWRHDHLKHTLVLSGDTTGTAPALDLSVDVSLDGSQNSGPRLGSWSFGQELAPSAVEMADTHFQLAGVSLRGRGAPPDQLEAEQRPIRFPAAPGAWEEDAMSPVRFADGVTPSGAPAVAPPMVGPLEGLQARVARKLAQGAVAGAVSAMGEGVCPQITPGLGFNIVDHRGPPRPMLATRVEHEVELPGRYQANAELAPAKVLTRLSAAPVALPQAPWPPRPKPNVGGVHTAVVTGPPGAEVNLDMHGRVRVRFGWDRDDGASGTWIRVAQCWAGNGYGAVFWPRVGHEVVVAFEGGDPDRPIIVGSVYNSANAPPYPMPASGYISGFKSCTKGGSPGSNFHNIVMNDSASPPVVGIHSEGYVTTTQEKDSTRIHSSFDLTISG